MLLSSRVQLTVIALASCFLLYCFFNSSSIPSVQWNNSDECNVQYLSKSTTTKYSNQYSYINMNNDNGQAFATTANHSSGHVLILTPFNSLIDSLIMLTN
jgi:hypothetical protein